MALDNFNDVFNLTMTFRRDSDLYLPYGTASQLYDELVKENISQYLDKLISRKTKLAIWIASNGYMRGAKERRQLSDQLIKAGLDLDRRGRLFPRGGRLPDGRGPEFIKFISAYKFYMSFENQWHCKGYFTEKAWNNGIRAETVPVLWGATKEDYENALPPGSYIYANDYSPQELTSYLNYLNKNDTAYREYFDWRTMDPELLPDQHRETGLCQLCRIMHGINIDNIFNPLYEEKYASIPLFDKSNQTVPRIVHSLKDEFYGTDYRDCH